MLRIALMFMMSVVAIAPLVSLAQEAVIPDPGLTAILNQKGKLGFEKFRIYSGPHKAFVICADGAWSSVQKRESPEKAIEAALTEARGYSAEAPCRPYAVDSQLIGAGQWIRLNVDEARVTLAAVELKKKFYWDEDKETGIPPTTSVNRTFHAPTPAVIPGAKLILTTELKQLLSSSNPPLLVNVLPNPKYWMIPDSVADNGIGTDFSSKGELDAEEFLRRYLTKKNKPVVFYCLSWQCWLSYNAALRATSWGYTEVYWYRGGVYSWFDAALPFVLEQ